jgi:RNA polymerase sigma factor (sigma-70 family)
MEAIKSGNERKRDWALYQFYGDESINTYCSKYVKDYGEGEDVFEDMFQEAIIIFDRNIRNLTFKENCSLKTYLISIFKWAYLGHKRKKSGKTEAFDANMIKDWVESPEGQMIGDERKDLINEGLNHLDARCKELLTYVKLGYENKELVNLMGFSSPEMAKKQAYRCRERLRDYFISRPDVLETLNISLS